MKYGLAHLRAEWPVTSPLTATMSPRQGSARATTAEPPARISLRKAIVADPDPHQIERLDPETDQVISWIRIRKKVKGRIRIRIKVASRIRIRIHIKVISRIRIRNRINFTQIRNTAWKKQLSNSPKTRL
jgi:hypothetical protein